jgi:hypothetical protein
MPTYNNSNTTLVTIIQPKNLFIPADSSVETNFYLKTLPEGVTLTSHAPLIKPWVLLDTVSSFPSSDIDVSSYSSIIIYNASDDIVTISANGDDANKLSLMAGSKEVWDNVSGSFGILTVLTNDGSGSVYIWGGAK